MPIEVALTSEIYHSFISSFYNNCLVWSFVTFQPGRTRWFVSNESLIAFKNQNWSVDKIEIILAPFLAKIVAIGIKVAWFLGTQVLSIVCLEGNRPITVPNNLK